MCTFQLFQLSAHRFSSDYTAQGWEIQAAYSGFVELRRQRFDLGEAEEAGFCESVLERRELCKERAPQICIVVL